jgi:2-polyprenyl-6-methoxyphenol hydroxylase-like FAD-dependent oxidoreductase
VRIAVLGGGPGGLLAAVLAKRGDPGREVTVFERNRAGDTFGFGVVFSDATLDGIDAADPVLRRALTEHGVHWDPIEVRLRGEQWRFGGNGMAAVARRTLLTLLQQRAAQAGVDLRFSTLAKPDDLLDGTYDLVIAADGANSQMRARFAGAFGPSVVTATAKFIWFGTTYPFGGLTFVHEQGPHGVFAVHGYPIGNGVSTFIVETDERSWREAGLDAFDAGQPSGPSDQVTQAYLEKLFANQIDGCPLLVNNSRWGNFRTWRTQRWRHRAGRTAIALLGDAAHTAHFSVGSGTKMAMEDAVALVAALDEAQGGQGDRTDPDGIDAALAVYESERAGRVARIQDSARPSLSWWEHFGRSYRSLPPWQFAFHFFSRSLPESKLRQRDAGFVDSVHRAWSATHGGANDPLHTPIDVAGGTQPGRVVTVEDGAARLAAGPLPLLCLPRGDDPPQTPPAPGGKSFPPDPLDPPGRGAWVSAPDTEAGLGQAQDAAARAVAAGACLVAVADGTPLTRRLVCEAARLEHGAVTMLVEDGSEGGVLEDSVFEDGARTAILSGRTDLVGRRQ